MVGYLHAITLQTPPPPSRLSPDLPAALEAMILRMLEKDTDQRPTAQEVDQALNELSGQRSGGQIRQTAAKPASQRRIVGRQKEREELRSGYLSVMNGRGQLLCVAGEPGIGKTTLVEDFLAELAAEGQCTITRGRCSERLAGTEAYLPLLEALESLLQSRSNPAVARGLKEIAPTWYEQVVPLSGGDKESAQLPAEVKAASQERMKRELGNFLQELARQRPLVLFFDDLHWADVSTIDVLSFLAGKFDALNVLIVVTYRPSDMLLVKHPFLQIKPDLQARGLCHELTLEFLSEAEIVEYLALEFPDHCFPAEFPRLIYAKTEGSPLFMVDLARYLRDRNVIAQTSGVWTLAQDLPDIERELPESVRGMIERKIAQLSEEDRELLTTASVQGNEFNSAVLARVLNLEADEVEGRLEMLEQVLAFVQLVSERELPNRTLTLRYRFVHVLYQNALYGLLRVTRKASLSAAVAQVIEGFYGEQRASVANELAVLWEVAREYAKAADYFRLAAEQAGRVFATREALALARRGLAMIERLPESRGRDGQEIALRIILGNALIATQGYTTPEVGHTYARARELCRRLGETAPLFPVLYGLCAFHLMRLELSRTLELADEFVAAAEGAHDPSLIKAQHLVSITYICMGELTKARNRLAQALSLYDPERHRPLTWLFGEEPGTGVHHTLAFALWLLGYPEQSLAHSRESLHLSREVSHAHTHANALGHAALNRQWRREPQRVSELTDKLLTLAAEHGLALWLCLGTIMRGWALAIQGEAARGIAEMHRGLEAIRALGVEIYSRYSLYLLAEAYGIAGQVKEGLAALDEAQALAEKNEGRLWDAELNRMRGELLLLDGAAEEVEPCFQQAIEIARQQQAKSLELRAVMSLARLWQGQGRREEARQMLEGIYGWFTEGFDTADLKDAKALLDELL
jgi:predicted ATPase